MYAGNVTPAGSRFDERLLDFSKAVARLEEALDLVDPSPIIIDAVIQRFEFTYELAWKTMKAYLESQGLTESRTPKDVIRESFGIGLIEDGDGRLDMLADRNLTSHTYREDMAREIFGKIRGKHRALLVSLLRRLEEGESG